MKKGTAKPKAIRVKNFGETWTLQPGHKVFECNLHTGVVQEHKLSRAFSWPWQPETFKVNTKPYIAVQPAFDIHKARIFFKHATRELKPKLRIK